MKSLREAADYLANYHRKVDPQVMRILWSEDRGEPGRPPVIRLLEVTPRVKYSGEIFPFEFGKHEPEVPYRSVTVLLNPLEWEEMKWGKLEIPQRWGELKDMTVLFSEEEVAASGAGG